VVQTPHIAQKYSDIALKKPTMGIEPTIQGALHDFPLPIRGIADFFKAIGANIE